MCANLMRLLCALWMALALAGCSGGDDAAAAKSTVVKLALNWKPEPEFGGFYAARESGDYARAGLDVQITSGMDHVLQLVASGGAEFGILGADEVITARTKGIDIVATFAVYQTNPQGLMAHEFRGFQAIGDILRSEGTVAVQPGLAYVDYLKSKYQPLKAQIVPYDYSIVKFLADKNYSQQCFITSEPIAARQKGADPKVFLIAEAGFNPYAGVVVTRGEYLRANPKIVADLVAATRRGWIEYLADPAPTNRIMSKLNPEMDLPTFAAAAEAQTDLIRDAAAKQEDLGRMDVQRWEQLGKQLLDLKLIAKAPPAAECFANP